MLLMAQYSNRHRLSAVNYYDCSVIELIAVIERVVAVVVVVVAVVVVVVVAVICVITVSSYIHQLAQDNLSTLMCDVELFIQCLLNVSTY